MLQPVNLVSIKLIKPLQININFTLTVFPINFNLTQFLFFLLSLLVTRGHQKHEASVRGGEGLIHNHSHCIYCSLYDGTFLTDNVAIFLSHHHKPFSEVSQHSEKAQLTIFSEQKVKAV